MDFLDELLVQMKTLGFAALYTSVLRYVFPALALVILIRCAVSLLRFRPEPEVWAWLTTPKNERIPVMHWENLLGRSRKCDVVLDWPTISRTHAVLTRYDDGSWSISDVGSKGGIAVNGQAASMEVVDYGDTIALGGVEFKLVPITKKQEVIQASVRTRAGGEIKPGFTLFWLTVLQVLAAFQLSLKIIHQVFASSNYSRNSLAILAFKQICLTKNNLIKNCPRCF